MNTGWVAFSKSSRDMVLCVLRQLSESGAVDELGIGTIRDAFSDVFFPGTSAIQTRAKYLFLLPYMFLELERDAEKANDFLRDVVQLTIECELVKTTPVNYPLDYSYSSDDVFLLSHMGFYHNIYEGVVFDDRRSRYSLLQYIIN